MGRPKWLDKGRNTMTNSKKQEQRLAKSVGGRTTAGSGNVFQENDVKSATLDIEAKTTSSSQYILKLKEFSKMKARTPFGKIPVFAVNFEKTKEEYAIIPMDDLLELLELSGKIVK